MPSFGCENNTYQYRFVVDWKFFIIRNPLYNTFGVICPLLYVQSEAIYICYIIFFKFPSKKPISPLQHHSSRTNKAGKSLYRPCSITLLEPTKLEKAYIVPVASLFQNQQSCDVMNGTKKIKSPRHVFVLWCGLVLEKGIRIESSYSWF